MSLLIDNEPTPAIEDTVSKVTSFSSWMAGLWTLFVSAWAVLNFVQLRIAAGLIELAGLNRGKPIDEYDHFSQLPELEAAFQSSTLTIPSLISWVMLLVLISVPGAAIGFGVLRSNTHQSRRILTVMATTWTLGVLVGVMHFETLDLLAWLDN